jgi:glyoxylase-like metal-dependent hydrolase (beta-lactamase superfamily II)
MMSESNLWQQHTGEHDNDFFLLGTIDVPMYLIKVSGGWALLEGSVEPLAPLILQQLKCIVDDLAHIKYWFITHSHYDHIGTLALLYPLLPCVRVFTSKLTKRALSHDKANEVTRKLTRSLYKIMPQAQHADNTLEATKVAFSDIPVEVLEDGQQIDFDESHCMVAIATPGHAKCLLSFYEPKFKRLYVSDALGEMVSPSQWEPLIFQDYQMYIASLKRLQQLDIAQLVLGHHGVLYGDLAQQAPALAEQGVYQFIDNATQVFHKYDQDVAQTAQHISELSRDSTATFVSKKLHYNGTLFMLKLTGVVPDSEQVLS